MSVFFTDSNCELMNDNGKQSGIEYINMPYISNSIRSLHACTTTSDLKNFYNNNDLQNIEDDVLTKIEYMNIFRPYLQQGNDIIYVTFSNSFTNCCLKLLNIVISTNFDVSI